MKIADEKVVALTYELIVDGQLRDKATEERPLEFIFGMGYLLPKFEEHILGKAAGEDFSFTLSPADGYGEYDLQAIVELPKEVFKVDGAVKEGLLVVGNSIPMMTRDGRVITGKVVEIADEKVKMDFNHELAGKELNFSGKVVSVREATEKELSEGLHGERAAHNCGSSGCSTCGGCH